MKKNQKISAAFFIKCFLQTITVFVFLSGINPQQALGQLSDNFSDGDFTINPVWSGSTNHFIVNGSQQLQLNNTVAATSYLSVPFSVLTNQIVTWEFFIQQTFASSGSNFSRVYLASDQQDLTSSLNGYYLQFGEAGTNDAVELFRQTGLTSTSVCRAANATIASAFSLRVKVTRDGTGGWQLLIDYTGGVNFVLQATGTDNTHTTSSFFGVSCIYTITNAKKFFYDDFSIVTQDAPDTNPPSVSGLTVISSTELSIQFSEELDQASSEDQLNYFVSQQVNTPDSVILQPDQQTVELTFGQPFQNGVSQTLAIRNVKDLAENIIPDTDIAFMFFQPVPPAGKDIIITEIFPDPSPSVGLPEAEFLELFNRSTDPFDLAGWKITDGTTTGNLSSTILLPGEYIIISANSAQASFSVFGRAMGVSSMPFLNNTADVIRLIEPGGKTIDSVAYSVNWHSDEEKKEGGWSLELIDPQDLCKEAANWTSSKSETGGTPGYQNSVFLSEPDLTGPKLMSVNAANTKLLTLTFDEKLAQVLPLTTDFTIEPGAEILSLTFADETLTKINLSLASDLDSTITYNIDVNHVYDCPGNLIQETFSTVQLKLDVISPEIRSLVVISSTELNIEFSERIDQSSAQNVFNYEVVNHGHPASAILMPGALSARLFFDPAFTNGAPNVIRINQLIDIAGNQIAAVEKQFMFFEPTATQRKCIIISEILADPTPKNGLPEAEFVEIFNRSVNPFDLNGWKFSDGTTTGNLLSMILLPGEYLILSNTSSHSSFSALGKAMSLSPFPSLNNTADALVLKDPHGLTVDSVNYSDVWYKDNEKKDGGWSLEIIDPENTCSEAENWVASEDEKGGTPGKQNSVFVNKPDLTGPKLMLVFPVSSTTLLLQFDEKLEQALPPMDQFSIQPAIEILQISFADPSLTSFYLVLAAEMQGGIKYELSVGDIYDCTGNLLQPEFNHYSFALPELAEGNDLAINEILFNPRPTGFDFVEIYNQSDKFINLKNWKLANLENASPINPKVITDKDFLVDPQTFLVFTKDRNVLKGEYLQGKEETFVEMEMPSFPDDEGSVALLDENDNIIDGFYYSDNLHSVFIKDDEGVSLERISTDAPINDVYNWKSASSTVGFATPGYLNSNSREAGIPDEAIQIEPEIFIPMHGQPDFTQIKFNFDRGGYVANVKIFDPQGRIIKQLANNALIGTDGFFRWDGDQDNGSKARIGSYMVWFEVFDSGGTVKTFRKRVVVVDKF